MNEPLVGNNIRLEPLERRHVDALVAAAAADPMLYRWSFIPQGADAMTAYVDEAIRSRVAGRALPYATIRTSDDRVIGSTRFFDFERWAWPPGHARHGRNLPDVCEIGYTWLARDAVRTAANTEAKLLMLTHAFEVWHVLRVCLQTDERNAASRAAIERIGGTFEGILRAHRIASDAIPRNSARYSIVRAEWPAVKRRLENLLTPSGG